MCRLLAVRDAKPFDIADQLHPFADIARNSREYQGDGWGCAWWDGARWIAYHSVLPIWQHNLDCFGRTRVLVAHARSAFRNEGIAEENNMPFLSGQTAFIFNGELRGVRISEQGRIGAEKLFRFLLRAGAEAGGNAAKRAVNLVADRTRYVRALNYVMACGPVFQVCSRFSEAPDYFTMHIRRHGSRLAVCSEPLAPSRGWIPIANGAVFTAVC